MKINCAHKELVDIVQLQPNPKNPNTHPEKQITLLAKIIEYQGQRSPIVVSLRSGFITKGHGRLEAIKKLGWEKAAVDYQEYESEAQEYADMVADNKIAELADHDDAKMIDDLTKFDWIEDFDLSLLGMPDFKMPEKFEAQSDEDELPNIGHLDIKAKPGDIFQLGRHRLMCGDSTNIQHVETLMNGEKADLIFTDPPYNIASDSKNFAAEKSKAMNDLKNAEWDKDFDINPALSCMSAVAKDSCTIYVWTSQFLIQKIWDHLSEWCDYTSYVVWNKPNPMPSLSKRHPTWNTELCVYASRGSKRIVNFPNDGHFLSCRTVTKKSDGTHPTQKPIELIEPLIEFSSGPEQNVLDLFGGSGSTLIACEKINRKCNMMELSPYYCHVIITRWEKYTGHKAELLNG